MFTQLRKSINSKVEMSDEDFEHLTSLFDCIHVPKETLLMKEGEICNYSIFVCRGCLCFYMEDKYGEEKVLDLVTSGRWASDGAESYWNKIPTPYLH